MQHLRLVGVHEDGTHLLLTDDDGNRFALPLDDPLRAAVRRDRPRLGQLQVEADGGLRPREVQAMIRAGLSAEEVAERAGWTVEKVHRYEGPILAERDHVAGLARQARLRARGGSNGGSPTLEARVSERLRSREIDLGTVRWDSRRTDDGSWSALLRFTAGGRDREAAWHYDPLARTVTALDDEARWLSEDEDRQAPGPIPAPHLSASTRPSRVYDVEAEGGVGEPRDAGDPRRAPHASGTSGTSGAAAGGPATRRREGETVDLMAAMRERSAQRRGRRRPRAAEVPGLEDVPEDARPLEGLARDPRDELPPPAHTHPEDDPDVGKHGPAEHRIGAEAAARKARRAERTQPVQQSRDERPEPEADPGAEPEVAPVERTAATTTAEDMRPEAPSRDEAHRPATVAAAEAEAGPTSEAQSAVADPSDAHHDTHDQHTHDHDAHDHDAHDQHTHDHDAHDHDAHEAAGPSRVTDEDTGELIEERAAAGDPRPAPAERPAASRKSGRPSVPSWDDIMFGRRGD